MPKYIDRAERERLLVESALRLIAQSGLTAASVRGVAAEAGLSAGSVRHAFPTQEQLIERVLATVTERAAERLLPVLGRLERAAEPQAAIDAACAVLEELLPLDEPRRVEWALWSAVVEAPGMTSTLARWRAAGWWGSRHQCRRVVSKLAEPSRGALPVPPNTPLDADAIVASTSTLQPLDDESAELRAAALHATLDGLAAHLVAFPTLLDAAAARAAVRRAVTDLASLAPIAHDVIRSEGQDPRNV